jgi:hypothetical protein
VSLLTTLFCLSLQLLLLFNSHFITLAVTTFNEQDISIAIKQLVSAESLASAQIGAFKSQSSIGSSFGKFISNLSYFGNNKNQQFMSNGQLRSTVIKA